jgi:hypothetical protein
VLVMKHLVCASHMLAWYTRLQMRMLLVAPLVVNCLCVRLYLSFETALKLVPTFFTHVYVYGVMGLYCWQRRCAVQGQAMVSKSVCLVV